MTLTAPSAAARSAVANFFANRRALAQTQPTLVANEPVESIEWLLARDGSLTLRDAAGRWHAGCSLPHRASLSMLKKMDTAAPVTCFLAPPMAASLRVALDKLSAEQAVVAICPDAAEFSILLACDDFSDDITAHRLWFTTGPDWQRELSELFETETGLSIPSQFLRLPMSDEKIVDELIRGGQAVFSRHTVQRTEKLHAVLREYPDNFTDKHPDKLTGSNSTPTRWCIMCPSHFRLWNEEATVLRSIADELDAEIIDTDDPAASSPLHLALSTARCGAFLAPNFARGDMPGVVPLSLPWFTWVTNNRIPRVDLAGAKDQLLVTDAAAHAAALDADWPAARVKIAGWPAAAANAACAAGHLTVLADTHSLATPKDLEGFSSHRVLWESIRRELAEEAFKLQPDLRGYLTAQMERYDIAPDAFPFDRFVLELILPAFQHALVRSLIDAKLPVELYGQGWGQIDEFASFARGAIDCREAFTAALAGAGVLVHVWPSPTAHAIDSAGRPVLRRTGRRKESFIREAQMALNGTFISNHKTAAPLRAQSLTLA